MSSRIPKSVEKALLKRQGACALRNPAPMGQGVDLCSNDYLGLSRKLAADRVFMEEDLPHLGATGSRLVSGTTAAHEELESFLAEFHHAESALLFGSGYEANVGLLGSIGTRHDTILYDELVHASMRDGVRLSNARTYSFKHNNLDELRIKMRQARGDAFVVVESVYSMDGDKAPLADLCALCEEMGAYLVVDEAHATGIFGTNGEGLVQSLGLESLVFARVHTFGKALGYRGAVVVGAASLREYLVNFSRPFIYSTAPDLLTLRYIREAYALMVDAKPQRAALRRLVLGLEPLKKEFADLTFLSSDSPIQGIIIPSNESVLFAERALIEAGYLVKAIRPPTVPAGTERIRFCAHSFNTLNQFRECFRIISHSRMGECAYG